MSDILVVSEPDGSVVETGPDTIDVLTVGLQGPTGAAGEDGAAGPNTVTGSTTTTLTGTLQGDGATVSAYTVTAAAKTYLDDATVAAAVDTLFGASSTGSGGAVRASGPTIADLITTGNLNHRSPATGVGTVSAAVVDLTSGFPISTAIWAYDETTDVLTIGGGGATYPNATLTGTPTAPTAAGGTNTTQVATTAFVQAYTGTTSVTTLGTVGTGTWQGTVVGSTYGGTGVNNAGRTLTISTNSGTISYSSSSLTLTVAAAASVSGTNTGDQLQAMAAGTLAGRRGGSGGAVEEIGVSGFSEFSTTTFKPRGPLTATTANGATVVALATSNRHVLTLTASATLSLTGDADGDSFILWVRGQASGYTLTWWSGIKWVGGAAPTIPTTSGRVMAIAFTRLASGEYWGTAAGEAY